MEEFSRPGEHGGGTTKRSFLYLPLAATSTSTLSAAPPQRATGNGPTYYYAATSQPNYFFQTPTPLPQPQPLPLPPLPPSPPPRGEAGSSQPQKRKVDDTRQSDMEEIKAKIMSHPQYSTLIGAFMDCQKVGAPPEVVARLSAIAQELASSSGPSHRRSDHASSDPELDQFMESYCDMLVKYREELARPLQEAKDFLKKMESQFNAIANASAGGLLPSSDEKNEGAAGSSEEEQEQEQEEGSGGEGEVDPAHTEAKELKHLLLKKYGGYLSSLRQELSKKKKKGKLPKDARQKLLSWWDLHYRWPYPSETEKVALAESTGLDQKQINNWFINQRKRHWKPSEDMQFVVMDGYHHHHHHHSTTSASAAALYMEAAGQFMGDGMHRLG